MRVEDFLQESARRSPDKTAPVVAEKRITFAELDADSDRLAAALHVNGVALGDRIVILRRTARKRLWPSSRQPRRAPSSA